MYAIVDIAGQQFKVQNNQRVYVHRLEAKEGDNVEFSNVLLRFTQEAVLEIAHKALARKTGARGLRAIIEESMLDTMFEVPAKTGIKEVIVSEKTISSGEQPLIVYEKSTAGNG